MDSIAAGPVQNLADKAKGAKKPRLDSVDDFMPSKIYNNKNNNHGNQDKSDKPLVVPIFERVKSFIDIADETVLQVIEVIPPLCQGKKYQIHLSDTQHWVTHTLDKVGYKS